MSAENYESDNPPPKPVNYGAWVKWIIAAFMAIGGFAAQYLRENPVPQKVPETPIAVAVPQITPPEARFGLHKDHTAIAAKAVAAAAPLRIVSKGGALVAKDNRFANVRLWECWRKIECPGKPLGQDWPNIPQLIGDCVSWGYSTAVNISQACEAVRQGRTTGPPRCFPPGSYNISRVIIGKGRLGNSDGSVGAWAATGGHTVGNLFFGDPDVPEYTAQVAKLWGRIRLDQKFYTQAGKRKLHAEPSPALSAEDARDAICMGFAVTIASDFGFQDSPQQLDRSCPVRDGRRVAIWNGSWPHQMCLIAYDGSGSEPYFYCINSWGAAWGPKPMQGEPAGGFWMTFKDVDKVCREHRDSWAIPGTDGFTAPDNLDLFEDLSKHAKEMAL